MNMKPIYIFNLIVNNTFVDKKIIFKKIIKFIKKHVKIIKNNKIF